MSKKRRQEFYEPQAFDSEVTPDLSSPAPVDPQPVSPSALMTLRVFATIAGPKWDQMAGFVSWAQQRKMGAMSMAQWKHEYAKFQTRPVG